MKEREGYWRFNNPYQGNPHTARCYWKREQDRPEHWELCALHFANWCVGSLTSYSFMNTEVLIILIIVRWGPQFRVQGRHESLTILQIYLITRTALSPQLFKTLSGGPAEVWTPDFPCDSPILNQLNHRHVVILKYHLWSLPQVIVGNHGFPILITMIL